jgi:phosphonate transport system ATP-binding protein
VSLAHDLPLAPVVGADTAGIDIPAIAQPALPPAIEVAGLTVSYVPGRLALDDVSLIVPEGALCMVLGPSGSGKSTLLKAIKGQVRPQAGRIAVFGQTRGLADRAIACIPQSLGLVRNLTVLENTLMGALGRMGAVASFFKVFPQAEQQEARSHLAALGIAHKIDEKVFNLSGGERQRVAIARALMQRPRLVLADEFVSQLDPMTTGDTMRIVRDIVRGGVTFLVTSHEIELVAEFGDTAVFLRDGRKVHECAAREVDRASAARAMGR